jgi:hypothetical protein
VGCVRCVPGGDRVTTPNSAAQQLGRRLDQLSQVIEQLRVAEAASIEARMTADVEESREYLKAQGSIEARKHIARTTCERLEFAARVAEAHVRHLLRLMREAEKRVDAGRTFSADLRAEASVVGRTPQTWT